MNGGSNEFYQSCFRDAGRSFSRDHDPCWTVQRPCFMPDLVCVTVIPDFVGNVMVCVEESVDIGAEPEAVFSLMTDVARKARLDPNVHVLSVGQETEGPVGIGTVFHYRLVIEGKIADYRSTCIACEPERMMETLSDTAPPFKIRVTVEPIPGGTCLTQAESFTLPAAYMPLPRAKGWLGKVFRFLFGKGDAITQSPESVADEEARMETKLKPRLATWLNSIKAHLETEQSSLKA